MKFMHSAAVAAAACTMLLLPPSPAGADGHGAPAVHVSGQHHGLSGHRQGVSGQHHPFSARTPWNGRRGNGPYGAFNAPFYGGGVFAASSDDSGLVVNSTELPAVVYVALPPQALSCHRSRETVTVPAEAGGTKAITITRC
jgi:hypothetical protein